MKLSPEAWAQAVPAGMRALPQWVTHLEKRPFHPTSGAAARVNDPSTWGTFAEAKGALSRYDGAGFVLTEKAGLVFVDFDHVLGGHREVFVCDCSHAPCEHDKLRALLEHAKEETYTEVSPSGTGVHAFYIGRLPENTAHRREFGTAALELYDRVRYSTITGERWGSAPLAKVPGAIERLASFMGTRESAVLAAPEPERLEEVMEALSHLDPDMPYPEWLRVGMALRAGLGESGRALWVGWSRDGSKYRPGEPEEKWRSFTGSGTGLGTILWMAQEAGWQRETSSRAEDVFTALPAELRRPEGEAPFTLLRADEVSIVPINWLWDLRIARGHLTVIMGDPKAGKTLMVESLASLRSRGRPCPGDAEGAKNAIPMRWVLLETEDDENDTTTPRLRENGAEMSMVDMLNRASSKLILPRDLDWVEFYLQERGDVEALVISPMNNLLPKSSKLDGNKDQDIRSALMPLVALAKRLNIAVIVIHHLNKNTSGPALYRGLGSIGFVGVARTVLLVGRKGDLRYVTVVGSNSREAPGLAFDIRSSERDRNIGVLEWLDGDSSVSAEELCAPAPGAAAHAVGAAEWLRTRLSAGPVESGELYREGRLAGFVQRTLERARDKAGVSTVRNGKGWVWKLGTDSARHEDGDESNKNRSNVRTAEN